MSLLQIVKQQKPHVFGRFMIEQHSAKIEDQSLLLQKHGIFFDGFSGHFQGIFSNF